MDYGRKALDWVSTFQGEKKGCKSKEKYPIYSAYTVYTV